MTFISHHIALFLVLTQYSGPVTVSLWLWEGALQKESCSCGHGFSWPQSWKMSNKMRISGRTHLFSKQTHATKSNSTKSKVCFWFYQSALLKPTYCSSTCCSYGSSCSILLLLLQNREFFPQGTSQQTKSFTCARQTLPMTYILNPFLSVLNLIF